MKMQPAEARRPAQWLVTRKRDTPNVYVLRPKSRRLTTSGKLSYQKACSSSSVRVSRKGLLSWEIRYTYRAGGESSYSILAAGKARKCMRVLGCNGAKGKPYLFSKGSSRTQWRLKFVKALAKPSSPPAPSLTPPPPVMVEVGAVSISFFIANETVESFGEKKQDALCATVVLASGDPTAKCRVTSVTPTGGGRRHIMQSGESGINVVTVTTFVTPVSGSQDECGPASLVNNIESQSGQGGKSPFGDNVVVEDVDKDLVDGFDCSPTDEVELSPAPPAVPSFVATTTTIPTTTTTITSSIAASLYPHPSGW